MKTLMIPAAILFLCSIAACKKCDEHTNPETTNCEAVFCTAEFAEVRLEVHNASGQPAQLDSFFVTDINGAVLKPISGMPVFGNPSNGENGVYTVLNDAWRTGHQNTNVQVRAHGLKNSVEVFNEVYEVSTDCCHVRKVSGKDVVMLP